MPPTCAICAKADEQLDRCNAGHLFCDTCANVQLIDGGSTGFCPLCQPPLNEGIPEEFICPITHKLFEDPVVAQDGHTYERSAIEDWFRRSVSSPMTGIHISTALFETRTFKSMIDKWKATHAAGSGAGR